jgi:hypothetical protein
MSKLKHLNTTFYRDKALQQITARFVTKEYNDLHQTELGQVKQLWNQTYGGVLSGKAITIKNQDCKTQQDVLVNTVDRMRLVLPLLGQDDKNSKKQLVNRKRLYKFAFNPNEIDVLKGRLFDTRVEKSLAVERQLSRALGKDAEQIF